MADDPLTLTSDDELRAAARTYVDAQAAAGKLAAAAATKVAKIKETLAQATAEHDQVAAETGEAIERYATEHRDRLLTGKTKTIDVGAATLSWRKGRESVVIADDVDVVDELQATGFGGCVTYPDPVVDKTALKKVYDAVMQAGVEGVTLVEGKETFGIKAS